MLHLALAVAATMSAAGCDAPSGLGAPKFEAAQLRQGRFTYDLAVDGKPAGQFVLSIRRQNDGSWKFTGDALGFDQHWEAVTDTGFQPRSALLALTRRGQPYRMQLTYAGGKVAVGETTGDPTAPDAVQSSEAPIAPATVDQRIDWASMMASDLQPGAQAAYHVFDAMTGSSRLLASAKVAPAMDGPLGRQEAVRLDYRICKNGEPERYTVYATRSLPRVMLREDLRGHEVAVLVKVEP
jgi:hypothetical protein